MKVQKSRNKFRERQREISGNRGIQAFMVRDDLAKEHPMGDSGSVVMDLLPHYSL